MLCRECLNVRRAAAKAAAVVTIVCVYCGKKFQSQYARWQRDTRYCSQSCISKDYHEQAGWSADKVREKVLKYLRKRGKYGSVADIRHDLQISEKSIYRFCLSVPQLNYEAGTGPKPGCRFNTKDALETAILEVLRNCGFLSTSEICHRLSIGRHVLQRYGVRPTQLRARLHLHAPHPHDAAELQARIIAWLKTQKQYCGVARIVKAMHIDFDCTWARFGLDAKALNAAAGHLRKESSWYEAYTFRKLCAQFGKRQIDRQKRFAELRSDKGGLLRFDFYIRPLNVLIEVDGQQHNNPKNAYYSERLRRNDRLKDAYAKAKGIRLHRVSCVPARTFEQRLCRLLSSLMENC